MTIEILMFGMVMLVLVPLIASCWYLSRKYGDRAPGGMVLLWIISLIIYYTLLFNFGREWLDRTYPIQVHQEKVCEIKTTYSRQGLN